MGVSIPHFGNVEWNRLVGAAIAAAFIFLLALPAAADPVPEQPGFQVEEVFGGDLHSPIVAVRFAQDGRAFVADRRGRVLIFDDIYDTVPAVIDLSDEVHGFWDRGLLGLAVDPDFSSGEPWIYLFYTLDTGDEWQGSSWGGPGLNDDCPNPPGATVDGCVVAGRLIRMKLNASNTVVDRETLLDRMWCYQFPSHSADDLVFGSDGMLYLSSGEGASFTATDYGQLGGSSGSPIPQNPCQDPPHPTAATEETGEGGALRSQDLRTPDDTLGYNGAVLRIDPDTGYAAPGNPLYDDALPPSDQPEGARVLGHGFRNPYRMAFGPDGDLYVGEVGMSTWEEIDRIPSAVGGTPSVLNFGWPCYEGREQKLARYNNLDNAICEDLYLDEDNDSDTVAEPFFQYMHGRSVWPGAPGGEDFGSAVSAIAFMNSDSYPAEWQDALVFADYNRAGVWALQREAGGYVADAPTDGTSDTPIDGRYLLSGSGIVDIQSGPGGELYLVQLNPAKVFRLTHPVGNLDPTARITADVLDGQAPLEVNLSGASSTDPEGDQLQYDWDLDDDGALDDATGVEVTHTFSQATRVTLRVTDFHGATDTDSVVVLPPDPTIVSPQPTLTWRVGDTIALEGAVGSDEPEPEQYRWEVDLHHCAPDDPDDCHAHPQTEILGKTATFVAPDHSYPSFLEFRLVADYTDGPDGESSVEVQPKVSTISVTSPDVPVEISHGEGSGVSPVEFQAIENGLVSLSVPATVNSGGRLWEFEFWSDGAPRNRDLTVPESDVDLVVSYDGNRPPDLLPVSGQAVDEGDPLTVDIDATDPDGDGVVFSLGVAPAGAVIDAATGVIDWTPGETHGGQTVPINVIATDDWTSPESSVITFDVVVSETNQPPTIDVADQNVVEGETLIVDLVGSDPDIPTQTLTYSKVAGPGSVSGNSWSWTPGEAAGPGTYTVTVRVSDGEATDTTSFDVVVAEGNRPPVIDPIPDQSGDEGSPLTVSLSASDPDTPTLTFSKVSGPGSVSGDTWSWTPGESDGPGTYPVTVRVSDGEATDTTSFDVVVAEVNQAPVIDPVPDQRVLDGDTVLLTLSASDPDVPTQTLSFTKVSGPGVVSGDVWSWTPSRPGRHTVRVRVSDGSRSDTTSFRVRVVSANKPNSAPMIEPVEATTAEPEVPFEVDVDATDPDGDRVVFSLLSGPDDAVIDTDTGMLGWVPDTDDAGRTVTFEVMATDDREPPASSQEAFDVDIADPGDPVEGFTDIDESVHRSDILALAASGITYGCNPPDNTLFCPSDPVTREQMASFLVRGLDLAPGDPSRFSDISDSVHESNIGALAGAGITMGCNPPVNDLYCPSEPVTREQMASFLVRGLDLAPGDPSRFSDISDSVHESDIAALAGAGITLGCNPPVNDLYCPSDPVTREQMASFLVRGLDLPVP